MIVIGVDIGQVSDPTAIVVTEVGRPEKQHPDDRPEKQHLIRWIERVPLGTNYSVVVDRIAAIADQAAGFGHPTIVIDGTGVGRAIHDLLRSRTGASIRSITFTAGAGEKQVGPYSLKVPKRDLLAALEVVLQTKRVLAIPDCPLQADLNAELHSVNFATGANGHTTYDAASGRHDDLVSAMSLAIYWGERRGGAEGFIEYWRSTA